MTREVPAVDEAALRSLVPAVIGILVHRGADFAAAEDAVQEGLLEALRGWGAQPPEDPKAWLVTVAWRKFLDAGRNLPGVHLAAAGHRSGRASRVSVPR